MQDYARKHDLSSEFVDPTSFTLIKTAIDQGKVVVIATKLTTAGHMVTVKGYTADGKLVINDPYGDKTLGYPNWKGGDVAYSYTTVAPKWHITVRGTPAKVEPALAAVPGAVSYPATLASKASATVALTFKNSGTATWDADTRLGTTAPRDRESKFYSPDWLSKSRVVATGAVLPGATASISFTITAPSVSTEQVFKECFNLVQEGTGWFSDAGQGGPGDEAVCLSITVSPPPPLAPSGGGRGDTGTLGSEDEWVPNCTMVAVASAPSVAPCCFFPVLLLVALGLVLRRRPPMV